MAVAVQTVARPPKAAAVSLFDWTLDGRPWKPPATIKCLSHTGTVPCNWNRVGTYPIQLLTMAGSREVRVHAENG